MRDRVRSVRELLRSVSPTLAKVNAHGERSRPRGHVNGSSTGKVEAAELERPSLRVPRPVGDGIVDERRPDERKHEEGTQSSSLGTSSDRKDGSDRSEHGLAT